MEAKKLAQRAASEDERSHYQALQTTFKILINSFYGYLGTSFSNFADFRAAGEITETGQQILKHMIGWLQQQGCDVIELDTDGIYFVPPKTHSSPEQAEALVAELAATLPEGIEVELDGRYPAMFSYKIKNYALLNASGQLTIKGSGLRSRGLERFQRQFLRDLILLLLTDREEQVSRLYWERWRVLSVTSFRLKTSARPKHFQNLWRATGRKSRRGSEILRRFTNWPSRPAGTTVQAIRCLFMSPARGRM